MFFTVLLAFGTLLAALYLRLAAAISHAGGVRRFGKPGVFGYIKTAIRWSIDAGSMVLEARKEFGDAPFVIPTLAGPVFLLPPRYLSRLRAGPDSVFDQVLAINEDLQLPYTMDRHQLENPYQARVMRTDVNRTLPEYIPDMLEETKLATEDTFCGDSKQSSISLLVFDTITHLVARTSNRVLFGTELCRNVKFIHDIIHYAETTPMIAPFIQWSPQALRPIVYWILSSILGGKKQPLKVIVPFLERLRQQSSDQEKPWLVCEHMLKNAMPDEPTEGVAIRMLNLEFGSIHTSSIFLTQALFEIAILPSQGVTSIRDEIESAIESEGGWNRNSLDKFHKIDSALREVGRCYGLMHFALPRVTMLHTDLDDGTYIPPGYKVAIDLKAIHFNTEVYADSQTCDLFRFSKMRVYDESGSKYNFTTVDSDFLPFGAGRHACAGRQFASVQLRIMLAYLLLEYDISLPAGATERPKNITFNGAIIPDPKAQLVFTPRSKTKTTMG